MSELGPTRTYSNHTATEILRRLLDERGVEWTANDGKYVKETCWTYMCELTAAFAEYNDGTTRFDCDTWCFTPEQAIDATLGDADAKRERHGDAGTCRRLPADNYYETCIVRWHGYEREFGYWKCSKCGTNCFEGARYCMNCGARVVEE